MKLTLAKYLSLSLITLVILIVNLYNWQSFLIALIFGFSYLILHSYALGSLIFSKENPIIKFIYGFLFLISIFSSLGAIIYYFYKLDTVVISLIIIFIPVALFIIVTKHDQGIQRLNPQPILLKGEEEDALSRLLPSSLRTSLNLKTIINLFLIVIYLLLVTYNLSLLFSHQTSEAIRSPWEVLPKTFFLVYFFASLVLLNIVLKNKKGGVSLILISLHIFLTFSINLIVYKIGFGFDPFIHRATEKVIFETGAITPKTLYYLGQYSLVVFLSRLTSLNLIWIDKLLVPLLATIYLPLTIYFSFSRSFDWNKKFIIFLSIALFILPLSSFIITTPQGLANFYSLIIIFLSLLYLKEKISFPPFLILGITDLFIHPLGGIPIIIFLFFLLYFKRNPNLNEFIKKRIFWEMVLLTSLILPSIFIIFSYFSQTLGAYLKTEIFNNPRQLLEVISLNQIKRKFNLIYDLVYFYKSNLNLFLLAVVLSGLFINTIRKQLKTFFIYFLTFFIIFINYFLLKGLVSFSSLIEYEQGDYPSRLLEISFYFLTPLFLYVLYEFIKKVWQGTFILKFIWLIFIALLLTISLYVVYPRADPYDPSHGFSTSASDIKAVHFIKEDSKNNDFIVLANQSVSAAALQEFSFKKYYKVALKKSFSISPQENIETLITKNDKGQKKEVVFYYSIPTGGPLYQFYLEMVYKKPTRETMEKAMNLVGVDQAYFVINKYWWHSERIIEEAMATADDWEKIDQGKIFVFKYTK